MHDVKINYCYVMSSINVITILFSFITKTFSAKKVGTFCCLEAVWFAAECYGVLALRQFEKFKLAKPKISLNIQES